MERLRIYYNHHPAFASNQSVEWTTPAAFSSSARNREFRISPIVSDKVSEDFRGRAILSGVAAVPNMAPSVSGRRLTDSEERLAGNH
ncbi:hypothetical protein G5I_03360 [Acromyrmex echinatior]|uniref:Uncharacterized protein n=1 Tax=Acromyrmex echinatior TaxID=103372 RepID=F4WCT2_ACREC|nr:hypothetical protein G5I_03360 [Acromyrmex echinatior]